MLTAYLALFKIRYLIVGFFIHEITLYYINVDKWVNAKPNKPEFNSA